MPEKTVLVIFPSMYSLAKVNNLASNVAQILKMKDQRYSSIRKNESLIIVEADDPVLASSAVNLLFGIDKIAIAKETESDFDSALSTLTNTAQSLLLRGEKFYVKVGGRANNFLAKDLEIAATTSLVDKALSLGAKPGSESSHDRLVYAYLTGSHTYVCIFVDRGLGGLPYNSQKAKALCCIHDELSAISCLQTIKMGFDAKLLICYRNESDLLKLVKITNKILPRIIEQKITLDVCRMSSAANMLTRITAITKVMASLASREKIGRVALGMSPMIFEAPFCELNAGLVSRNKIMPWFPLSGIDSEIFEDARELGLDRYAANLETLCKKHHNYKKISMDEASRHAADALKSLKRITVAAGPNNIHDIIDLLKSDH